MALPDPNQQSDPLGGSPVPDSPAEDQPLTTEQLLHQVIEQQQQHRAEVASLRADLARTRPGTQTTTVVPSESPEDRMKTRLEEVGNSSHYCPACGRLYNYQRECVGDPAAPHAPVEVVSTDELQGDDSSQHTPAPSTG